jgi:hypothetical protein
VGNEFLPALVALEKMCMIHVEDKEEDFVK